MIKVLIIKYLSKFPLLNSEGDSYWRPFNNTVSGDYWLQLEAEEDLKSNGISYEIGEVEIKVGEI